MVPARLPPQYCCRAYFDHFSRKFHGERVTVTIDTPEAEGRALLRDVKLFGIVLQSVDDRSTEIDLSASLSPDAMMTHVIRNPIQVDVRQVTNGHDDRLVIRSATDPTTFIDFDFASAGPRSVRCR